MILIDKAIVFNIGSGKVLGQFAIVDNLTLIVELAQIDGGGEGILANINSIAKSFAEKFELSSIEYIVHAINCANPNLKLRSFLEKNGFQIKNAYNKGEAYYKKIDYFQKIL